MTDLTSQEGHETWMDYRKGQEFEHLLIDRKTSWFLAAQSLLFAAYGLSLGQLPDPLVGNDFRRVTARLGLALSILAILGVLSLIGSKLLHWRQYESFFNEHRSLPPPYRGSGLPWGAVTWMTPITLLPDLGFPFVFLVAWNSLG